MLLNTRRRMLGLLAAAIGAPRLVPLVPVAHAAETEEKPAAKKSECFALQAFGDWKGVATNTQAGARIGQISFADRRQLRSAGRDFGRRQLRREARPLWRSGRHAAAQGLSRQAREPPHRQERGRQHCGRRAVMRRVHRHSRRQGQHRPAAFDRRAVPRGRRASR